ncbi:hypothetical protein AB0C77_37160, partial [Streptomyces sp. NPDC048629]|uniref:hypothetical protein n=1 Tax=Streptomyces sp. NPDC048629 TaxID=3154824 RepID=UPI0034331ABA
YGWRTGKYHPRAHATLLRRMARESRRDMLDHLAKELPHVPKPVMIRLADTWHRTFSYLSRHTTRASSPEIQQRSGSVPDATVNVFAEFTARAQKAAADQNTTRPDYTAIAAGLFHPDPTPLQLEAVRHLAPVPYTVTREGALATAETIVALMGDEEPTLSPDSTRAERIDYVIWQSALDISQGHTPKVKPLLRAVLVEDKLMARGQGWLFAFGLGGALRTAFTEFGQLPHVWAEIRETRREFMVPRFIELSRKLTRRIARERQRTGMPEGHEARQEQQVGAGDGGTITGEIDQDGGLGTHVRHMVGMYRAWGLDDGVFPKGGVRYRLAEAARKARDRANTAEASDIAAQLLGVDRPGIDHIMLVENLLRPDLNLEDPEFPGPAQVFLDLMGDRVPAPIPGPRSSNAEKNAWNRLDPEAKLQRRIEVALYTAAQSVVDTGKLSQTKTVVKVFADKLMARTPRQFNAWFKLERIQMRGWLEAFGFGQYMPPQPGQRRSLLFMDQAFDEAWEMIDLGEDVRVSRIASLGMRSKKQRYGLRGWLEVMGLLGGGIPPGSVRDRMLQRVQDLMNQGVDDEVQMAQRVLGVRRPYPTQVIAVKQMMRLRGGHGGAAHLPVLARQLVSHHHRAVMLPPQAHSTLQDRIDYAIWRAASSIAQEKRMPLAQLTELVFNQAPSRTTPLGSHATSPIGTFARRYFLLGVLTAAGLRPSYQLGSSVAKYLAAIVGEYQIQKADPDGAGGASQHSTARELFAHVHLPHAYQAFIWGVLETLGLRGTALPRTGLRANMKQSVARMLQQNQRVTPATVAGQLFGTGDLTPEGMTATGLWMKLAATDTPPPTTTGAITPPGWQATLEQQAEYVVEATLDARSQPGYAGDDIEALVESLFGTTTDEFGWAFVTGVLEGTGVIRLNNGLDPDQAHPAHGSALTSRQVQHLELGANLQDTVSKRLDVPLILNDAIPHRQQRYHARVRGLLAGRGILPPLRSGGPLQKLRDDILDQARQIRQTYGTVTAQDIDQIAYQTLLLTTDPDDHQRRIITSILADDGITVQDPRTHPDDDVHGGSDNNDSPDSHDHPGNHDSDDNDNDDDNDDGENGDSQPVSGPSGIGAVLEGTGTLRTVTEEDLTAVQLPDLDELRAHEPEDPPQGAAFDAALAADYAAALALRSSAENPVDSDEVGAKIGQGAKLKPLVKGAIFASGGYCTGKAKAVETGHMKTVFRLVREKQKKNRPHTATSMAALLPVDKSDATRAVQGFLMAVGHLNYPIGANGARDRIRKSIHALADVFEKAGQSPDPRLIAQRIYTEGRVPEDRHIAIVEEFLRQRDREAEAEAGDTGISEASQGVDLGSVSLNEIEVLRSSAPSAPVQGDDYDPGLAADYAMWLALSDSTPNPLDAADHIDWLAPKNRSEYGRVNIARALLYATGNPSLVLDSTATAISVEKMRDAFSFASEYKKPGHLYTPSDVNALRNGRRMKSEYLRGYWIAAGLRDYAVRRGGAWSVVQRHVGLLAAAFERAGKEPDSRVIARLIYAPQGRPRENQVAMVDEFLRQRGGPTDSGATEEIDLDAVRLDDLEELRTSAPEPPALDPYDSGAVADYVVALGLAKSSPVKMLDPIDHARSVSPYKELRDSRKFAYALLFTAGVFAKKARVAHEQEIMENMGLAFEYARKKQSDGLAHTFVSAAQAIRNNDKNAPRLARAIQGSWMAVGLGGYVIGEGGARDVVRKAVFTLADVFEDAGQSPDAVRIAQRVYARGQKPLDSQVAVVEEFLRQREEM